MLRMQLRKRKIKRPEVAESLGYKSIQTVANLLSSHQYLNQAQANALHDSFGFSVQYLTSGRGNIDDTSDMILSEEIEKKIEAIHVLEIHYSHLLNKLEEMINIWGNEDAKKICEKLESKRNVVFALVSQFKNNGDLLTMVDQYTTDIDHIIAKMTEELAQKEGSSYPVNEKSNFFLV